MRRQAVENEWGVSMSEMEHMYYENQKTERKMFCSRGVDPVWYHSAMRAQRMKERMEEYRSEKEHQFQYKTLDSISELLAEAGEIPSNDSSSNEELSPIKRLAEPTKGIGMEEQGSAHESFPLPILSIHGDTAGEIAMQVDMGFEILASVRGVKAEEEYKLVDTHMTDSAANNEGSADLLAEMYNLKTPAGQLFCGTHTTLGFSSAMNKVVRMLEVEMKMEQVMKGFMVELEKDSKNGSLGGHALDMCLKLVAPEYSHKPWKRHKEFLHFLQQRKASNVLFSYKDSRFGCLSRAAAVLIYNYDHMSEFLNQNNRIACLVREVMEFPYLKVILVVFACRGQRRSKS